MKIKLLCLVTVFSCAILNAQTFTNGTSLLNSPAGGSPCVVDMNADGLDDVVTFSGANLIIDYQQLDGTFSEITYAVGMQNNPSWSVTAGDLDNNGYPDLMLGGGSRVSFVLANADGTAYTEQYIDEYIFSQRTNMSDIDNDGFLDAFACHDVDLSHPYRNDGTGVMVEDQSLLPTVNLPGNYASIFVDFDNDGDTDLYMSKCKLGSSDGDIERQNKLFVNDGLGGFTEESATYGLFDDEQSWVTVFEDFDNDGDFDTWTVNHTVQNYFRENDGTGHYTDITAGSGFNANDLGSWAAIGADFDNDGFVDILMQSGTNERFYHNDGDMTFTASNLPFDRGALGDLNNDGFVDVWTGATLWLNDGNANNWSKINLEGVASNRNGIGARVELHGDWGMQIREARSGENFQPASNLDVMFGIGASTEISMIRVLWPSGEIDEITNPAINSRITIVEGSTPLTDVVSLSVKTMLEGAYNATTGLMVDQLRVSGDIPITEPFTDLGYTHMGSGGEVIDAGVLDVTGSSAIVDWIWVEIRDGANPTDILVTKPCLVRADGMIVDVTGNSNMNVDLPADGSFMVALRHKSHLGFRNDVATSNLPGTSHFFDMSDASQTFFGTNALNEISGVWMMISGEANGDGQVNSVDRNLYWRVENGLPFNYSVNRGDFNLDGTVNAADRNLHWRPNSSKQQQLD